MVLMEVGPKPYWRAWDAFIRGALVEQRLIAAEDTTLYRIVESVEDAVTEIKRFYRVFHSARIVGENLVLRLQHAVPEARMPELQRRFEDILKGPATQAPGPVDRELNEFPNLPRLILPFNRNSYARLRQLIDFVNEQ
jgi:hypothetical protein